MKSIDTSAPLACGRADTTKASMLNANRNFFIIVRNEAFDFTAPRFIQLPDSKTASPSRVLIGRDLSLLALAKARRRSTKQNFRIGSDSKCDFLKIAPNWVWVFNSFR